MTRRVGSLLAALPLAALLVAAGCGTSTTRGSEPDPAPSPAAGDPPAVEVVGEDEADLHLWVSNQSFVDDPVAITVSVDGVTVVDRDFDVEGQHNWQLFPLALEPGEHALRVASDTGVTLARSFRVPEGERRYAVVDYWNYEDEHGRHFTWRIHRKPLAFA